MSLFTSNPWKPRTNIAVVRIADISTAETLYLLLPKCKIIKISSVLAGAITVANATITASRVTTALTNGVITIAFSGSAAGDVDLCEPTANNVFDGTQYLKLVGNGGSTTAAVVLVTAEYEPR